MSHWYHDSVDGVRAFVLAGGRSTRMGTDKAMLRVHGETLLQRALKILRELDPEPSVVGLKSLYADFAPRIVEDTFVGCGPLGGIHAALGASDCDLNLLLAVDTPEVVSGFLQYLVQRAKARPDALAIVPDAGGGIQGTCALYRRPFRSVAEQQLKRQRYRITETLALVQVEYVEEQEMREAGFDPAMFANLNTPEDVARLGIGEIA